MIRTKLKAALVSGLFLFHLPYISIAQVPKEEGLDSVHLELTLEAAIQLGLQQSPIVLGKDIAAVNQMYAERQFQSSLYPQVSLSGNYGYTLKKQRIYFDQMPGMGSMPGMEDGIEMGRTSNIQMGLQAGVPLVNAVLWQGLSLNRKQVELALQQAQVSRQELVGQIKRAFYAVLLAQESYETLQRSMQNAALNLQSVEQKYKSGLVAEYDKLRAEVQYANIVPNVLQAEQGVQLALMQMAVLIGVEPTTSISLKGSLVDYQASSMEIIASVEGGATAWQEHNPSLRLMDLQAELLKSSERLARMHWIPSLSLSAVYNYNFSSNAIQNDFTKSKLWVPYSMVGVQINIPLFSGLKDYYSVRKAKGERVLQALQRKDMHRSLTLSMQQQLNHASMAAEQYQSTTQVQEAAERGYLIAQKRYDTGMGTLLEVNDAEVAWMQAKLNQTQALYNYLLSAVAIEQLVGAQVETPNEEYQQRLDNIRKQSTYF